mmetsp:Transcript_50726/g.152773  ORF Transcript_50726/g.152773 Transcript_50726/m.152773 type:complete len:200 (-) Transcript_50726:351-950(-)
MKVPRGVNCPQGLQDVSKIPPHGDVMLAVVILLGPGGGGRRGGVGGGWRNCSKFSGRLESQGQRVIENNSSLGHGVRVRRIAVGIAVIAAVAIHQLGRDLGPQDLVEQSGSRRNRLLHLLLATGVDVLDYLQMVSQPTVLVHGDSHPRLLQFSPFLRAHSGLLVRRVTEVHAQYREEGHVDLPVTCFLTDDSVELTNLP